MADLLNCVARMYDCRNKIAAFPNSRAKIDLQKMYNSVTNAHRTVNSIWVECRRKQKVTATYQNALDKFEQLVANLEQYITIAYLTKDI